MENPSDQLELCFVVLKPDCLQRGLVGEVMRRIENAGLRPDGVQQRTKTAEWVEQHSVQNVHGVDAAEYLTAGPVIGFGVGGPKACERMWSLIGDIHSPGSIVGDFGVQAGYDLVMASENHEEALRQSETFYSIETDVPPIEASKA